MLIGFVGLPNSGKTSIAAKVFCHFKELSINTELIVEQARFYIANKRIKDKLSLEAKLALADKDQFAIFKMQKEVESIMKNGCTRNTIIISDSSTVNIGLYLENFNEEIRKVIANSAKDYDAIIFCHPFDIKEELEDPNRVHDLNQIKALSSRSKEILKICKENNPNTFDILGTLPLETRYRDVCSLVLNTQLEILKRS